MRRPSKHRKKPTHSEERKARDNACFRAGAAAAAELADTYNATTTHARRLGDCILFRMNLRSHRPRLNAQRVALDDAVTRGVVLGVAEMLRVCRNQDAATCALRGAGITKKLAEKAGCPTTDLEEIDWKRVHKKTRARRA
jgi:hypothetical protein